jgi:hypothetical protein
MAEEGWWEMLGTYCLNDTRQTHRVSSLERILLPKTKGIVMDGLGGFSVAPPDLSCF